MARMRGTLIPAALQYLARAPSSVQMGAWMLKKSSQRMPQVWVLLKKMRACQAPLKRKTACRARYLRIREGLAGEEEPAAAAAGGVDRLESGLALGAEAKG